jgi:hypothetical protein
MMPDTTVRPAADTRAIIVAAIAVVAWSGVLLELGVTLRAALESGKSIAAALLDYFGYFTIFTNILVASCATALLRTVAGSSRGFFGHPQVLGCAAASIVLVALVYHFMLSHLYDPEGLAWFSDLLLHYVVPTAFVLYWILALPRARLPWWSPLAWSLYPLAFLVYTLLRGALLDAYPYPFIDVAAIGYAQALANALGLFLLYAGIGAVLLLMRRAFKRSG